jgi:hypothetical protein
MNAPKSNDDTYSVSIEVKDEGKLELPDSLVKRLRPGSLVHIVLAPNESRRDIESREWANLTAQQFMAGYSQADSIYDTLDN